MNGQAVAIRVLTLALSISLLAETHYSHAQTNIQGGNVSGTWAKANSPYDVNGEVTVPDGQTLTIEPGVAVVFTGNYKLNIQGRLLAIGTKQDTITFTAQDSAIGWHGLRFVKTPSTNDTSRIIYCKLQYGQATIGTATGDRNGGAIYIDSFDKVVISNCLITKNMTAGDLYSGGAGIGMGAASPRIENNMISYNSAIGGHGGGIAMLTGSNPYIKNNIITKNHATGGGAVVVLQGNPLFINNTIAQNVADLPGDAPAHGGAMCTIASNPLFFNTIIYGNRSGIGNQAHLQSNAQPTFAFCTIEGGIYDFARELANHGFYSGTYLSNIDADPLFVSSASDNYYLSDYSPCIGAGGDSIQYGGTWYHAPQYDYEGNPRPNPINSTPDIGALENALGGHPLNGWIQTNGPEGGTVSAFTAGVGTYDLLAGTSGGGVSLSTDGGTSWSVLNDGLTNTYVQALARLDRALFAGTAGGVFRSTNNGVTWIAANTGLTDTSVHALAVSGSNLFAGTSGGVFLSTNNGASWTAVGTGLTKSYVFTLAVSGSNLFAGTSDAGVFLSANGGSSWTEVNTGLTNVHDVNALAVSGTNLFAGTDGGVFRSTDNGANWSAANTGLANSLVFALCVSGSKLFAGTSAGVFCSTNNATSWTAGNTGLTNSFVCCLACNAYDLFAGTPSGVWRRPLSEMITSVGELFTDLPTGFILRQNYPNPFNPTTVIEFGVAKKGYTTLKLYNVLGQEVATLYEGSAEAGEINTIRFNASGLGSGVYFYRLISESFVNTKKLILLR
jgi:hypothetical protein